MSLDNLELDINSADGDSIQLTIASNAARTSIDTPCREAMARPLYSNTGRIRCLMKNDTATTCTNTTGVDITGMAVVYPCTNVRYLSFYGTVDGDKVDIQYRM